LQERWNWIEEDDYSERGGGGVIRFTRCREDHAVGLLERKRVEAGQYKGVEEQYKNVGVDAVDPLPDPIGDLIRTGSRGVGRFGSDPLDVFFVQWWDMLEGAEV